MKFIFGVILLFQFHCSFSQEIQLNFNYGGNGVNGFIGQRSLFLNDSAYSLANSLSANASIKVFQKNTIAVFSGLEFQKTQRIDYERIRKTDGFVHLSSKEIYTSLGINLTARKSFSEEKYSLLFSVFPMLNVRTKFIDCVDCANGQETMGSSRLETSFNLPIQLSFLRSYQVKDYAFGFGPFMRYSILSMSDRYTFKPFFGGIQLQVSWRKSA
jgi:hypothetical protein